MIWSNDINGVGYDMVLIGQTEPVKFDIEKFEEKLKDDRLVALYTNMKFTERWLKNRPGVMWTQKFI